MAMGKSRASCLFESRRDGKTIGKTGFLVSRLLRSLKVIGTDTDRSATDDFPLTFYSDHGPILCGFQDIASY